MRFLEQIKAKELRAVYPVLSKSQADDLHFEEYDYEGFDGVRYWLSRVERNLVTIEVLRDGRWEIFDQYVG